MSRYNFKCPYCGAILESGVGAPSDRLGIPFRKCFCCGKRYIKSSIEEWAMKSPWKRFKFFVEIPFYVAFLLFITVCGLFGLAEANIDFEIVLIIGAVVFILSFICAYFMRKKKVEADILLSIERTLSADYVNALLLAGIRLYPIKGVEIGTKTAKDVGRAEENEEIEEDINQQK